MTSHGRKRGAFMTKLCAMTPSQERPHFLSHKRVARAVSMLVMLFSFLMSGSRLRKKNSTCLRAAPMGRAFAYARVSRRPSLPSFPTRVGPHTHHLPLKLTLLLPSHRRLCRSISPSSRSARACGCERRPGSSSSGRCAGSYSTSPRVSWENTTSTRAEVGTKRSGYLGRR